MYEINKFLMHDSKYAGIKKNKSITKGIKTEECIAVNQQRKSPNTVFLLSLPPLATNLFAVCTMEMLSVFSLSDLPTYMFVFLLKRVI